MIQKKQRNKHVVAVTVGDNCRLNYLPIDRKSWNNDDNFLCVCARALTYVHINVRACVHDTRVNFSELIMRSRAENG